MDPADIAVLERDTVAAVAPPEMLEIGGWLVPLDNGTIGRAKSAVPLRHDIGPDALSAIEEAYRSRGLKPGFRLADVPALEPVYAELTRGGFAPKQPTIFKTGSVPELAAFSDGSARILDKPDDAWAGVFLGEGFDPADGAHRVKVLTRSPGAIYAAAGEAGATHAVGVMSFGAQWAGIHGMRTAPAHRGKGHASAILAAMGRVAQARGLSRVFLQVEEPNPARRIYRAAGFAPIWRYRYWR
ncbi:GNAT family N-acetyltransferase [Phenylobacterium sp.]|uniref:GNAT family N-acetyltransferase n=1 Tax=Phenylobacterium sp. TaxID=1871053 RepID=UPI002CAF404E|nr:GNAT family N-acetyltransferase [Phenylobacterium sp.]HLZ77660.1 GNAT family N-acetyltransferase [Phenylobacterium sp.]